MIRKFIPLDKIEIYDDLHELQSDGTFLVYEGKDGKTTEEHRQGIDYIKEVLKSGKKIMPILVLDNGNETYTRLDGFKRSLAYKELGYKNIEAFVCDREEYATQRRIPFLGYEMWCGKGGQPKEVYPLLENEEMKFLYKSDNPHGLRIEMDESIHIHWGRFGRNRLIVGKKDFIELAEAVSKINGAN